MKRNVSVAHLIVATRSSGLKENPGILDYTWCLDEAWFPLSGYIDSQNSRIWASENPNAIHEEPLYSEKIGVWCGMSQQRIIGPIFFDATVTTAAHMEISTPL